MKTVYGFIFCFFALLNSGCKKCPTITHYPFPAAAELYFGMYKQGNWWTYENQDGTKKDSIYFTAFYDITGKDNTLEDCVTWQHREGNIGSNYLYPNSNSSTSYVPFIYSNPYEGSQNSIYTTIKLSGTVQERLVTYKDGTLYQDSVIVNFLQNSKSYSNVIKNRNNKYFAPNIGLIRWEIGTDTFTLKTYHIQ